MMRYTPNGLKSCLRTYPMRARTTPRDTTKATTQPTARITISGEVNEFPFKKNFTKRKPEAPTIVGIAKKNVNSAATEREHPSTKPPMMVAPERDVPGMMDST